MKVLLIFTFLPLVGVTIQDIKFRAVSWYYFPLLFMLLFAYSVLLNGAAQSLINLSLNTAFITVNLLLVSLYFSIKHKRFVNIFRDYFGLGDLLFFICLAASFSFINYIIFLVSAFVCITIISIFVIGTLKGKKQTIPLAGAVAIFYLPFCIVELASNGTVLFRDELLLKYLYSVI